MGWGVGRKGMNASWYQAPIYSNKIAALVKPHESSNLEDICITIAKTIFCNKGAVVSETSNSIPFTEPEKTAIW